MADGDYYAGNNTCAPGTTIVPGTTVIYPWTYWTGSYYGTYQQKCPNCGYCSCCGKSDVPGKIAG
jgi:hypothetical protein